MILDDILISLGPDPLDLDSDGQKGPQQWYLTCFAISVMSTRSRDLLRLRVQLSQRMSGAPSPQCAGSNT